MYPIILTIFLAILAIIAVFSIIIGQPKIFALTSLLINPSTIEFNYPIILTIFLVILAIIAVLIIMPQIFFNKSIIIGQPKKFAPKSLLINPSTIELNITSKDLQSEWIKTITITNIWKEKEDIIIKINGFQDRSEIGNDFAGYIDNQVVAIDIENLIDKRKVNKHLKEMNPSSSIMDLNMKISAINENIVNYNSKINLIYYNLKTPNVQNIIPKRTDIYINMLNNKIKIINEMPESSFDINTHDNGDIIENVKNCIDNLRNEIKDYEPFLEPLPDTNTPNDIYIGDILKLSIKDKSFSIDKDDTKFIILKIIIPYGLPQGEYRGEISINNKINDETRKLGVIPISINNSTNTESKQSIQTENKSANSTSDSKSDSIESETKSTSPQKESK